MGYWCGQQDANSSKQWHKIESADHATALLLWTPDGMTTGLFYDGSWRDLINPSLVIFPCLWQELPDSPKEK